MAIQHLDLLQACQRYVERANSRTSVTPDWHCINKKTCDVASMGTDGIDGNTKYAGAIYDTAHSCY